MNKMSHFNFSVYLIAIYFGLGNCEINNKPPSGFVLDHINIAVKDLEKASRRYQDLGFSIKPGRLHKNGILNAFVKFQDGSLLELISSNREKDPLSKWYSNFIIENPRGAGAFCALKVEQPADLDTLRKVFEKNEVEYKYENFGYADILSFPENDPLHPFFFIHYSSPVKDKMIHLIHPNTAQKLYAVWIPERLYRENPEKFQNFAAGNPSHVELPFKNTPVKVIDLDSGKIYLVSDNYFGRIVGATVLVKKISQTKFLLERSLKQKFDYYSTPRGRSILIPPQFTLGIWLEFLQQ